MANIDIKVFESVSLKEKAIFEEFLKNNWVDSSLDFTKIPKLWVVGYRNERIVGLFMIYDKEMTIENGVYKLAALNGVVTRVDFRRQGVMSQILNKFFSQYISKYKFEAVVLSVDFKKVGKLFGRVGFVPINESEMILGLSNKTVVSKILKMKIKLL